MKYAIGLDVGIGSVGYAVVALNSVEEPCGIIRLGSHTFTKAENPKTGASLAEPRREARSARRRIRRKKHRIERLKKLIVSANILSQEEIDSLYDQNDRDIYKIRASALDKRISNSDLMRALLHIAKRRGFKSNRKSESSDKEAGKLLSAVEANKKLMAKKQYRTVGEMFYKDDIYKFQKRNKAESYLSTVHRSMTEEEVKKICEKQVELGNNKIKAEFISEFLKIMLGQRPFDEGPGGNSPYSGNLIEKMIGSCTFEKDQKRAAKATYSFELFSLLQKINSLRLIDNGHNIKLTPEQRLVIRELAHTKENLNYNQIRKALNLSSNYVFNFVNYDDGIEISEKKTKFNQMQSYHRIRKALNKISKDRITSLTKEQKNAIGYALSAYKTDKNIIDYLKNYDLSDYEITAVLEIGSFSKFGHLSIMACDKIIPFLETGLEYDKACSEVGYDFKKDSGKEKRFTLPSTTDAMESITSPVVKRAVSRTIKVINAIIREQGCSPIYLNIELAREMSKDFQERNKIIKSQEENRALNERIKDRIKNEFGNLNPTGLDIVKLKLWQEQDGKCIYSQKPISINRLFEAGYADVDHIIPYSICFDDSYKNKVLVLSNENRQKGNRLPLQYLTGERKDRYIVYVNTTVKNLRKKQNLLKKELSEEDKNKFKERNLQDTKTMSRFLYNYIRHNLLFAESHTGKNKRVTAVNGAVTSHIRKRWGIQKIREDGDIHHAVDALVVACTTDKMIQEISRYYNVRESYYVQYNSTSYEVDKEGEVLKEFPAPWNGFRDELTARTSNNPSELLSKLNLPYYRGIDLSTIKPVFVSRMPRRKVTGAAHKETYRSARLSNCGYTITKTALSNLKLDSKTEEILNYYNPESDKLLYEALIKRLKVFKGSAKDAFAEPFFKPKSDGSAGPLVKKVKIMEKSSLTVPVLEENAVADNGSMIRIDIFHIDKEGYYFVPIYTSDVVKPELPNKAVISKKPYFDWKEMSDKDFIFSVYPNDLLFVEHKTSIELELANKNSSLPPKHSIKKGFFYFIKANISSGVITVENHDSTYKKGSLGIKTLERLEKYQVDVLGNYYKVCKEKRQGFKKNGGEYVLQESNDSKPCTDINQG